MGIITDILKEIPLSVVLRERIVDHEAKMAALEQENFVLKAENLVLKAENLVLKNENENLKLNEIELRQVIKRRDDIIQNKKSHDDLLKNSVMQWGCIKFPPDTKLYCPACFHKTGQKIETSRADIRNRFCSACKTTIPSG